MTVHIDSIDDKFHISIFAPAGFWSVRLVGGSNLGEGRVEVNINNEWGTICDDSWDINDAEVVCRQLGFGSPFSAPGSARFGQGAGRILLENIFCSGNESSLASCSHRGVGSHNCRHSEDASVVCSPGEYKLGWLLFVMNSFFRVEVESLKKTSLTITYAIKKT